MAFVQDVKLSFGDKHVLCMQGIRNTSTSEEKFIGLSKELMETVNRFSLLKPALVYEFSPVVSTKRGRGSPFDSC